jgi:glycogen operon protein
VQVEQAYNFAIYSKHATRVELHLFSGSELGKSLLVCNLDSTQNKSGPIWHTRLPADKLSNAKYYAYRIDGPSPAQGFDLHQFDFQKLLVDPYARDLYFPASFSREKAILPGDNLGSAPLGVLPVAERAFDWGDDHVTRHGSDLIIYELHIRGFTKSASSQVAEERRGTFLGVIDKIPYLQELGVTAVELMPVFQFDPQEANYWGYMPLSFFAPHEAYASASASEDQHTEFREMVKQLHRAVSR